MQWPFRVGVPVSSGFGYRVPPCGSCSSYHRGVDLTPGIGTPIQAMADGVVTVATSDGTYGEYVVIEHLIDGQRVESLYAHMLSGSTAVQVGQQVKVGELVGLVGNTGLSTGRICISRSARTAYRSTCSCGSCRGCAHEPVCVARQHPEPGHQLPRAQAVPHPLLCTVHPGGDRLCGAGRRPAAPRRRATARVALDLAIWAVPFGIVGARVWHVLTHPEDYFFPGADLLRALYLWEGGLAIFGAVVFGLLGIAIGAGRARIPALVFLDAIAPGMLIAQATGRLGNYFNQELFGAPTTLPWGLQVDPGTPRSRRACRRTPCSTRCSSTRSSGTSSAWS